MAYDRPYIIAFDADDLTDGQSYNQLSLEMESNWDFKARRATGLQTTAAKIQLRDAMARMRFAAQVNMPRDYILVPEIDYLRSSFISFDLNTVAKSKNVYVTDGSMPNYWSQIAFQGIRRFDGGAELVTPYRSYDYPFMIQSQVTVDWTGRLAPTYTVVDSPRAFVQPVTDFDFVLMAINVTIQTATDEFPVQSEAKVKLLVQDASRLQMMNVPILDKFLSAGSQEYNSVFPVPGVLYPTQSEIRYSVVSLLVEAELPATLYIDWIGVYRRKC